MRSREAIEERLSDLRDTHDELMQQSGDSPCKPSGEPDTKHIRAVSNRGFMDALSWVLEEDA